MTSNKVILTYKRKRLSSHFDFADVNEENLSFKSPKRLHSTRLSKNFEAGPSYINELKGDDKCDNAGDNVQRQVQESDGPKCQSPQGFERGVMKSHSYNTRASKARLGNDASLNTLSNSIFVAVKSLSTNGTPCRKVSSQLTLVKWDVAERSSSLSIDSSAQGKSSPDRREASVLRTFISAERDYLLDEKAQLICHDTAHKERAGTPLLTFHRRAKKRMDANDTDVQKNLTVENGEGATSDKGKMVIDKPCEDEGPIAESPLAPVLGKGNRKSESNLDLLHLNGKCVAENFDDDVTHEPSPSGGSTENKSERSTLCCSDRLKFTTNGETIAPEEMPPKVTANCASNSSLKEFSSVVSHEIPSNEEKTAHKPLGDDSHEDLFDSRHSSNCVGEEPNLQSKALQLLETTGTKKGGALLSAMQDFSRERTNPTISSWGRNFIQDIGDPNFESQQRTLTNRTLSTDFLDSNLKCSEEFLSIAPTSSLGSEGTGYTHEVQRPWKVWDSGSSFFRRKQLLDDILTSSRMLNKRPSCSFGCSRKYPGAWSEEELDSLWIGVRRHGRGNWNAMIEDPKLHFSGWRIAEDLAERWDTEQSRLVNAPLFQVVRMRKPDHSPSSIISDKLLPPSPIGKCDSHTSDPLSESQTFRNERELSLADSYCRREWKNLEIDPIQFSNWSSIHPLDSNDCQSTVSSHTYRGQQRNPFSPCAGRGNRRLGKAQMNRYACGSSMLEQNSVERLPANGQQMAALPASTILPHWLIEVLNTRTTSSETALHPSVSSPGHPTVSSCSNQRLVPSFPCPVEAQMPPKDTRHGILKRKGTNGKDASGSKASDCAGPASESFSGKTFNPVNLSFSPLNKLADSNILDLNRSSSECMDWKKLVVLDSDASSEETISDDERSRC